MLKELEKYDMVILLMAVALTCFGIVMVYSTSSIMAASSAKFHDGFYFLKRQGIYAVLGGAIMVFAMRLDYHVWKKWAVVILFGCLALLCAVLIPGIGASAKGATRWIRLPGFNLQPSELAKIALIVYMAYSLDKKQDKVKVFSTGFLPYMVILAFMFLILLMQHDLGSAVTLAFVAFMMLFLAGARLSYFVGMIILAAPFMWYFIVKEPYRLKRIIAFLNPWNDPTGSGFQIIQSWIAVGTGGMFGQGLGESKLKNFYLPEAHTDFILAVAGEELGFVGVFVIAAMFLLLVLRSIRVAMYAEDSFGRFLAYGIAVLLGTEAFVNMAVVTGMVPTKGLALPFISYGGSSLIVTLFSIGILLSVSSRMRNAP